MDIRKLCLLCLSFLSAFNVYAQAEKKDSTVQDNKGVLITLTDGIATTVRHTGRKIRKVGKNSMRLTLPISRPTFTIWLSCWNPAVGTNTIG